MQKELTNKIYKLRGNSTPLVYYIPSKSTSRAALLVFDSEKGYNRALRYAKNQRSPYEDEQDNSAIHTPVMFRDGF